MSIQCRKCGASRAALEARIQYTKTDGPVATVRCMLCGWRRSRPVLQEMSAAAQAAAQANPHNSLHGSPLRVACGVLGCDKQIDPLRNQSGLCTSHKGRMYRWETGARTRPAPYVQRGDHWIANPEREPRR